MAGFHPLHAVVRLVHRLTALAGAPASPAFRILRASWAQKLTIGFVSVKHSFNTGTTSSRRRIEILPKGCGMDSRVGLFLSLSNAINAGTAASASDPRLISHCCANGRR